MKIMIVDDHPEMRRMLGNIVSLSFKESVELIECESGEQAVIQYRIEHPDCVLMDFQLHKMNGFEATRQICEEHSGAKVIIVTSYDNPAFRAKAKKLAIAGFVSKHNLSDITPLLESFTNSL